MFHRKFRPQQAPHRGRCLCQCLNKFGPEGLFRENTRDITNALVEILITCRIHECKAKAAREVIRNAFKHYDDMRHRTNETPRLSLSKDHVIYDLGCKCMMTRIEAQLTYAIMKRAFKAFYHGTSDFGIRNPILEAQLIHSQEPMWVHAAKRTAKIYEEYEGMFFPVQKNFEECVRAIYKELYENMRNRASPVVLESCCCENCVKRIVPENTSKDQLSIDSKSLKEKRKQTDISKDFEIDECQRKLEKPDLTEEMSTRLKEIELKRNLEKLPRCTQCKGPKLICNCLVDRETGVLNYPCSQGPFKVRWTLVRDDDKADPCIHKPRNHECPIDCDDLSEMTFDGTDEREIYECEIEQTDEDTKEFAISSEQIEDQISTELSDTRTVYSCHMPVADYTPIMLEDKNLCAKDEIDVIKDFICKPKSTTTKSTTGKKTTKIKRIKTIKLVKKLKDCSHLQPRPSTNRCSEYFDARSSKTSDQNLGAQTQESEPSSTKEVHVKDVKDVKEVKDTSEYSDKGYVTDLGSAARKVPNKIFKKLKKGDLLKKISQRQKKRASSTSSDFKNYRKPKLTIKSGSEKKKVTFGTEKNLVGQRAATPCKKRPCKKTHKHKRSEKCIEDYYI